MAANEPFKEGGGILDWPIALDVIDDTVAFDGRRDRRAVGARMELRLDGAGDEGRVPLLAGTGD